MNEVLASGAVDVVGLARPLAVDQDFPAKLIAGNPSIVSPVKPVRFINKQFSAMADSGFRDVLLKCLKSKGPWVVSVSPRSGRSEDGFWGALVFAWSLLQTEASDATATDI